MVAALFSYRRGSSLLHKANAGFKIIFLFAFSLFVFWGKAPDTAKEIFCASTIVRTAICLAASAAMFFLAGANWKSLLGLRFVIYIGLMMTALKIIATPADSWADGAAYGLLYTARFLTSALAAQCVFETTTMVQIQDALHLPLVVTLCINFIPQIFSEWEKIKLAARARTNAKTQKNPAKACALFLGQLQALLFVMLQKAETTRRAVANRRCDF